MQTQLISRALPIEIRWLLAVAGWLLPPALRSDWLREWYAEFWHWPGSDRDSRRQMWTRAFGAFPDAWVLLTQDYGIATRIQDTSRSRSAPVILLALLMAAAALLTSGFNRGRNLLFHDDSAGLVLVAQPIPFMGGSSRMPAAQAPGRSARQAAMRPDRARGIECAVIRRRGGPVKERRVYTSGGTGVGADSKPAQRMGASRHCFISRRSEGAAGASRIGALRSRAGECPGRPGPQHKDVDLGGVEDRALFCADLWPLDRGRGPSALYRNRRNPGCLERPVVHPAGARGKRDRVVVPPGRAPSLPHLLPPAHDAGIRRHVRKVSV